MRRNPLAACILQLPRKFLRRPPGVISQRKLHAFASDLPCCRRNLVAMHSAVTEHPPCAEDSVAWFQ